MNHIVKRLSAWVLMAAYVPLLLVLTCHTHEWRPAACADCSQHVEHPAHFEADWVQVHDCLLCQVHTMHYYGTAAATEASVPAVDAPRGCAAVADVVAAPCGLPALRAPPCC